MQMLESSRKRKCKTSSLEFKRGDPFNQRSPRPSGTWWIAVAIAVAQEQEAFCVRHLASKSIWVGYHSRERAWTRTLLNLYLYLRVKIPAKMLTKNLNWNATGAGSCFGHLPYGSEKDNVSIESSLGMSKPEKRVSNCGNCPDCRHTTKHRANQQTHPWLMTHYAFFSVNVVINWHC